MEKWLRRLVDEARIAYAKGQKVEFSVVKREGRRSWRVFRSVLKASGEETYVEED